MDPLDIQLYRVSVMALAGVASGLLFDLYRVFRWATSPKGFIVHLEDLAFWVILTPLVVFSLLVSNWVDLRLYMLIGFGAGLAVYLLLGSPAVIMLLRFVATGIARGVAAIRRGVRWIASKARAAAHRVKAFAGSLRRLTARARGTAERVSMLWERVSQPFKGGRRPPSGC